MIRCFDRGHWLVSIEGRGNYGIVGSSHVQKFAYRDVTPDVALDRALSAWAELNCIGDEDDEIHGAEITRFSIESIKAIE